MLHLLQKNVFGHHHYEMLTDALDRMKLRHQVVQFRQFYQKELFNEDGTPVEVDTKNVFCWGSVKLAHVARDQGWDPGSFMNDNHDYRVYAQHYGDEMLNSDSQVIKFGESFTAPSHVFFARPCGDTKTFGGQCFIPSSWEEFVKHALEKKGVHSTLDENTMVQISSHKTIEREFRVWVVKGRVITASQYKIGTKVVHSRSDEPMVLEYAQRMVDIYQPAEAFVLDVCMADGKMKVVEVNCINCAGFYDTDLQKLLAAVEDAFDMDGRAGDQALP